MGTVPLSPALSPHSLSTNNSSFFPPDSYSLSLSPYADTNSFNLQAALKANHFAVAVQNQSFAQFQNGGLMTEDLKSRPRNMSQSSTDRELSTDVKPPRKDSDAVADSDSRQNPLKRKSTDTIDYPRRRATIAVRFFRASL
jgi:hypothetical protein